MSFTHKLSFIVYLLLQIYLCCSHSDQTTIQYFKGVKTCVWTVQFQDKSVYPSARDDQFFSTGKGQCEMNFIDNTAVRIGTQPKSKLVLAFFRPKYRDIRMAKMQIPLIFIQGKQLQDGLQRNLSFKATDIETDYSQMQFLQIIKKNVIQISYQIDDKNAVVNFNSLRIILQFEDKASSLLLPFCFVIYNMLLLLLSQVVISKRIIPEKISLLSLYHSVTFMLFLSVLQLLVGIAQLPSFHSWFILSGILTVILAIRMIQTFEEAVQRMIGIRGYLIFYISLFSYLWLLLNYGNRNWLLILNSLSLVPQIVHNIRFGNRLGLQFSYITIIMSNQLYVLYIKSCSDNILRYHPDYDFCKLILLLAIAQVVFITLQNIFGPLFFVPKLFIPGYHNYFDVIQVGTDSSIGSLQCPICLCPLGQNPQNLAKINLPSTADLKDKDSQRSIVSTQTQTLKKIIMRTPCGHNFHRQCLSDWMEYKLQCPVDRSPIPPVM